MKQKTPTPELSGLERAIRRAGGQGNLAAKMGVCQQLVSSWKRRGWVSAEYALAISKETGIDPITLVQPQMRLVLEASVALQQRAAP